MDYWKVSLVTLNCGKTFPHGQDEYAARIVHRLINLNERPDLLAVGFEEFAYIWEGCFPTIIANYMDDVALLVVKTLKRLFPNRNYSLIAKSSSGAIALLVFAEKMFVIGELHIVSCKRGMLLSSLKGATAISFNCQASNNITETFTFICNHYTANEGLQNQEYRKDDYKTILKECATRLRTTSFTNGHIFILGDLNFRLRSQVSIDTISALEISFTQQFIRHHDELTISKDNKHIFDGFQEADISFPPTYKYLLGSAKTFNAKRIPSWCDRILFREYKDADAIEILSYNSVERFPELQFTDHQPVFLNLKVKKGMTLTACPVPEITVSSYFTASSNVADTLIGYSGWMLSKLNAYWLLPLAMIIATWMTFTWLSSTIRALDT